MSEPVGVLTFLFTDLVGSTAMLDRLGDDRAEELRRQHFGHLRLAVGEAGGHEVKNLGDGLMVSFASPLAAIGCAVAMQRAIAVHNRNFPDHGMQIRVGLHAGEPAREGDDFFGTAVVVAKRLCDRAKGGQILVSELLSGLIGTRGGYCFRSAGRLRLKGFSQPVGAVAVEWDAAAAARSPVRRSAAPPSRRRPPPRRGPALVGRERELRVLEAELERAARGEFRCALIVGEAGVGKSRLAAELLSGCRRRILSLSARAYPLGESASFGLWAECLDRHLHDVDDAEVSRLCGGLLDDLAGLLRRVAAVRGSVPEHEPPRQRLLEALSVVLDNLARQSPMVILLDDVHWADASSWEALRHLAGRLARARVLVVAPARPDELADHQLATQVLLALSQDGVLHRLALNPIEREGMRELARTVIERDPPEALVSWLDERSRGNPLFALGLVRALLEEGGDLDAPGLRVLPEELADRVSARMKRLDDSHRGILEVLAVLAQQAGLGVLGTITGRSLNELGPVLDELVQVRFVTEEERGRLLRYEIAHPLYGQAIYELISVRRRRLLHRQVGRTLLAAGRLAAAAPHFACSAEPGDDEAIRVLCDAMRQAEERDAYREALTLLSTLVDLIPHGDGRWLDVLDAMSRDAQWISEHRADVHAKLGIRAMRQIDHVLEHSPDPARRGMVKLQLGSFLFQGTGELEEAERESREALVLFERAGDGPRTLLAALEVAFVRLFRGGYTDVQAETKRVLTLADITGDRFAAMHASFLSGAAAYDRGRFTDAEEMLRRSIAIAREDGTPSQVSRACAHLALSLTFEGRVDEALQVVGVARAADPDYREAPALQWEIIVRWAAGDFGTAQVLTRESMARLGRDWSRRRAFALPFAALALLEAGRSEDAHGLLRVAVSAYDDREWYWPTDSCRWAEAVLGSESGGRSGAVAALRRAASGLLAKQTPTFATVVLVDLAEVACECGDLDAAGWAAAELQRIAEAVDRNVQRGLAGLAHAWAATARGKSGRAADAARRSVALLEPTGWRAHCGRAVALLGRALSQADRRGARDALLRAADIFEACGATRRHEHTTTALAEAGR